MAVIWCLKVSKYLSCRNAYTQSGNNKSMQDSRQQILFSFAYSLIKIVCKKEKAGWKEYKKAQHHPQRG
ncbi:MAG: hypothetical protein J7621_05790 [Niastella sp.]|nr:hypothetical protein [Niastella sp.]